MQIDRRRQRRRHEPRQHLKTPARDDQAGRATRDGQHETFADQLSDHAAPACPERETHGDFTAPSRSTREEQVGDVGAGDEEHRGRGAEQQHTHDPRRA